MTRELDQVNCPTFMGGAPHYVDGSRQISRDMMLKVARLVAGQLHHTDEQVLFQQSAVKMASELHVARATVLACLHVMMAHDVLTVVATPPGQPVLYAWNVS